MIIIIPCATHNQVMAFSPYNRLISVRAHDQGRRGQRLWTADQRLEQSRKLRERQIWLKSTGPQTDDGKAAASLNAVKHGYYSQNFKQMRLYLRMQKAYSQTLRFLLKYDLFEDDPNAPETASLDTPKPAEKQQISCQKQAKRDFLKS